MCRGSLGEEGNVRTLQAGNCAIARDGDAINCSWNRVRRVTVRRILNWERAATQKNATELLLKLRVKLQHVALELNVANRVVARVGRRDAAAGGRTSPAAHRRL